MNTIKYSIIIILTLVITSCGITKRNYNVSSDLEIQDNYLNENLTDEIYSNTEIKQNWWKEFNDPILDTLINRVKNNNLDISAAVANFKSSRAFLKEHKLDRFPQTTLNGNYTRTRLGENIFVPGLNPTFNNYNGSFDTFWEADVFGNVSHRIKGAYANSNVALADMQYAYVRIFAETAKNYLELRGTQHMLKIAQKNVKGQQETYNLTVKLQKAGTSNSLDVSRAKAQLEQTKSTIYPLKARIEALKNSISVLAGEIPGELDNNLINTNSKLPDLPNSVNIGNIKDLLRRRADVKKAEAVLQKQIAKYNISVASLYPKIQFGGSIGFSAVNFSNFAQNESFTWNLMPSISWAAFNLGKVKQQIKQNDALTLAALSNYEKTVLKALEEIKTSLSYFSNEITRKENLRASSEASYMAAQIAKQRYEAGLDNFLDYLSSENTMLNSQLNLAKSEIASATYLVNIYKALGGGWEIISEEDLNKKMSKLREKEKASK